ncbi:MAG TPA: TerC family protein [Calditrichia bacterium]|nr:TerC family protein [Calditrichota bacterium]HQU74163.1 TerC family protein [Calditrichia bacterium]HQV33168.1 TerC family protein [Calditrichia bacterium]
MFEWIADPQAWIALGTLTALEIVLGIDNIIFITILVGKLPEKQRRLALNLGLGLAMISRLILLFSISWVMSLTADLFAVSGQGISGRDIILIVGGLFLLTKSTREIHHNIEEDDHPGGKKQFAQSMGLLLVQIAVLDIVFSLDSVITAIGLAKDVMIMAVAIVIAVGVMLFAAQSIGNFVEKHPTIKILALSFLILVGMTLILEGFDVHVPKGYIYFAMAFSVGVEMVNLRIRDKKRAAS